MVLGHEAAGIVAELGPGVSNVKRGDHVIFIPSALRPLPLLFDRTHRLVQRTQRYPRAGACMTAAHA